MDNDKNEFPDVYPWQLEIIERYGDMLHNTGGNDPRDLLQRYQRPDTPGRPNRLASTNVVVFTLAVGVAGQIALLSNLERKGRLGVRPGDLVEKIDNLELDSREVLSVGRDWLTLDLLGTESPRLPLDNYRTSTPAEGRL